MKNIALPDEYELAHLSHGLFDDFYEFVTGDKWTLTADTGGTAATVDGAGGLLTLTSDADDNDEAYLESTREAWKFAAGKPLVFEARAQYAEANTDDANVLIGLMDAVGADSLVDNGGGPKASFSGAVFYKVDGGTKWRVRASVGSTNTDVELSAANTLTGKDYAAGGASFQRFRIEFRPWSASQADVMFYIDGELVYKIAGFTFTSATEMQMALGVKAGGANAEAITVDYMWCRQLR